MDTDIRKGSNLGTAGEWPSLRVQEGDYLLDGEVFELDSSSSYREDGLNKLG